MSAHEVSPRPGRVAVIGGGRHGHLMCHAMNSIALPLSLDMYEDRAGGRRDSILRAIKGVRRISGIDAIDALNRADVLARYDAVVYALDAYPEPSRKSPFSSRTTLAYVPSALRGLPLRHGIIDNCDGAIRGCSTEFVVGPLQQHNDSGSARRAPEDVATLVERSMASSSAAASASLWSDADPADWLAVQFPHARVWNTPTAASQYCGTHLTLVG